MKKNSRSFTNIYRAMTVQSEDYFFQTFRRKGNAHKKFEQALQKHLTRTK
ncbi:MAG: hypothetical protein ACI8RD_006416 [Bacillariaceae sp.]|jgi:hypothetical protein